MSSNSSGEKNIRQWWGGISDDIREQTVTAFNISKHFDTITSPNTLTPYRDTEADQDLTFRIKNFLYANTTFYGLGRTTDNTKTKLYYKDPVPITGTWTAVTGGAASNNDTTYSDAFAYYKSDFFGIRTGNVWRYATAGSTFNQTFLSLGTSVVQVAPPVIHPITDRLFFAYNNIVAQVDYVSGSPVGTDAVLTLPNNLIITSMTPFGDSLAIACSQNTLNVATSRVYLWNMIDPTPYQMIDWGQETLKVIETVDNQIVGVSIVGDSSFNFNQTLFVKTWSGGDVVNNDQIQLDGSDYTLGVQKVLNQNRLYFNLVGSSSTTYSGIWVVGRKNEQFPFQTTIARKIDNDNTVTSVQGMYQLGDYFWVAHSNDGSVDRTNNDVSYTATSFIDSQKYNGDDPSCEKQLRGVAVSYVPLTAAGQVVLQYRKDEESSWTTIFTETNDNAMSTVRTAVAATTSLPSFYEIQFRIQSTGGAQINQLRFKYDYKGSPMD